MPDDRAGRVTDASSRSIPSLDGLRALAILLVVVAHAAGTRGAPFASAAVARVDPGTLGVRIFFVISGYLITHLLMRERETRGAVSLRRFYLRRTLRIFPPAYVYVVAVALLGALGLIAPQPLSVIVRALTYTSTHGGAMTWQIGHTWSLSVEEQFYLLWPFAFAFLPRGRAWWAPAAALVLCPFVRVAELHGPHPEWLERTFETMADALASGCLLALFEPRLRASRAYAALQRGPWFALVPVLSLAALGLGDHPHVALFAGATLANVGIALCIHWSIVHATGAVGRVLNARPVMAIGRVSYSLYLWQELFLNRYASSPINAFPLNLGLAFAAALASYYLVERPSLRLRPRVERWLLGAPAAGVAAVPREAAVGD